MRNLLTILMAGVLSVSCVPCMGTILSNAETLEGVALLEERADLPTFSC